MHDHNVVHHFLGDVSRDLEAILQPSGDAPLGNALWQSARYAAMAEGAKRSRPVLVYRFGGALDAPLKARRTVAVAAELIHAASLVHDDVIDKGTLRRGRETVNLKWDNVTAVLSGDLMLSLAFRSLHALPRHVTTSAVEVLLEMSCAAVDEVHARGKLSLDMSAWRAIAEGKTGALFGWCGSGIARAMNDEDQAQKFETCGRHLGVAFQLADDLKDLIGNEGKDAFADIKNRNPNYPLLWASAKDEAFKTRVDNLWQNEVCEDDAQKVGAQLLEMGAREACAHALRVEVDTALAALEGLRENVHIRDVESWANTLLNSTFGVL